MLSFARQTRLHWLTPANHFDNAFFLIKLAHHICFERLAGRLWKKSNTIYSKIVAYPRHH